MVQYHQPNHRQPSLREVVLVRTLEKEHIEYVCQRQLWLVSLIDTNVHVKNPFKVRCSCCKHIWSQGKKILCM